MNGKRVTALAWVALCYLAALAAAAGVVYSGERLGLGSPLAACAAADVAATIVVFAFSVGFNNSSFYDPYWSVAPMVIAPFLAAQSGSLNRANSTRQLIVLTLVAIWGARLTWNWVRGWTGLGHEDWRYRDIRAKAGTLYWPASFLGLHFFPTVLVLLGCGALWPALAVGTAPLGALDLAALVVTGGAIWIEGSADNQLRRFVRAQHGPGTICKDGLWAWSRHPNYFGEVSFWWGLFLFGWAADSTVHWTIVGPLAMTGLFVFVSVPLLDKRSLARRPQYAEHMKKVSRLIPLPPRFIGRRGRREDG